MNAYYQIPLSFSTILKREKLKKCDLMQSIKNFIHLIILSSFQEYRRDSSFGCDMWENEFEILPSETKWQTQIKSSITSSIKSYETRLEDVNINIETKETTSLMKRITINVSGTMKQTAEPFAHNETIYLCPKSIDKN